MENPGYNIERDRSKRSLNLEIKEKHKAEASR